MKSDILEGIEDADNNTIDFSINQHGFGFLSSCERSECCTFIFSPDQSGINNAQDLISALEEWIIVVHNDHMVADPSANVKSLDNL